MIKNYITKDWVKFCGFILKPGQKIQINEKDAEPIKNKLIEVKPEDEKKAVEEIKKILKNV